MMVYLALFCSLLLGLSSCDRKTGGGQQRQVGVGISQKVASERSQLIRQIRYQLNFDLTKKDIFTGVVDIFFEMSAKKGTTLDFFKGEILELQVNDQPVKAPDYNGEFLSLKRSLFKKGGNHIKVKFRHAYSKNGVGLYRYADPVDQRVYTYTDFEPFDANHMFPCFDQPDLKATFSTKVKTPGHWQVISATREKEVETDTEGYKNWDFPESEKFSTYVYSLHAGDYHMWESQVETRHHKIPLRLFARKSIASYVQIDDWFVPVQQGFVFFEKYFGYPYPYKKYDQVIVPDFNSGAMENVAAVTFNEDRFVFKGTKQKKDRRRLANTILHELAHMWFGNLVTMEWWDDLWLNESFATFMANRALVEVSKEYRDNWINFFSRRKQGAYQADQWVTTHPIVTKIAATGEAFANFDAITYGKGASTLKQLVYFIGEENFKKGLKAYFHKFAHQNTKLVDFMGTMEAAAGLKLEDWSESWLKTASLNHVSAQWECAEDKISKFHITQSYPKEYPTLRPHKSRMVFLKELRGKWVQQNTFEVTYSKASTSVEKAVGKACPSLVYLNDQDHDYVKVLLDDKSLQSLQSSVGRVEDDLLRTMLWADYWEMVVDQKISAVDFLKTVEDQGMNETVISTQRFLLEKIDIVFNRFLSESSDLKKVRKHWLGKFENTYRKKVYATAAEPKRQKMWFEYYVRHIQSSKGLNLLVQVLKSRSPLPLKFKVDQDIRWTLLTKVASHGHKETTKLLNGEKKRDSSKRGRQKALVVEAIQPLLKTKKSYFERVSQGVKVDTIANLRAIMNHLFPAHQEPLQRQFSESFFNKLRTLKKDADIIFLKYFTAALTPQFCDMESSNKISNFVKTPNLPMIVIKNLKVAAQENRRCAAIRQKVVESFK